MLIKCSFGQKTEIIGLLGQGFVKIKSKIKTMQREIKFRGLDLNDNWVYGDLCTHYEGEPASVYIIDEDCTAHKIKPETKAQYTGLKSSDEGGLLIVDSYFGDIIRFYNTDGLEMQAEIIWYEAEHCIAFKRLTDGFIITQRMINDSGYFQPSKLKFEVIGNIYKNEQPKLKL